MDIDSICVKEHLTFLKYLNAHTLFYFIVLLTFCAVFSLAWILKKYTFFEKCKFKIFEGTTPTFPYGNFKDVVNQNTSLHEFMWKYYNRFKRKEYKYGGLFLFTRPVILLIDSALVQSVNKNRESLKNVFPDKLKLDHRKLLKAIKSQVFEVYLEQFNYSLKGSLPESIQSNDCFSAIRTFLLESVCLAFGFKSLKMTEEINDLIKAKTASSFRYYFSLSYPLFKANQDKLRSDLKELFLEIMESRKKNDEIRDDFIQCFIEIYNDSSCAFEDIVNDIFDIFVTILSCSYSTSILSLYELAKHVDIQEDVIGEIRRFKKSFTYENLKELTYLDAVVKETLRKYPPVPTASKICCTEDVELQLPKDTLVYTSILGIHRDPKNYTKPDEFDPDRFMDEKSIKPNIFLPFGMEERSDIDMQLTTLQVKLTLINIFSSLRVHLEDQNFNSLKLDSKLLYLGIEENFSLKFKSL